MGFRRQNSNFCVSLMGEMFYSLGQFASIILGIEKVIFNDPATVVLWKDGTKTVVKCQNGDEFSKEYGLAMAICKKAFGNTGKYNDVFKKWCEQDAR